MNRIKSVIKAAADSGGEKKLLSAYIMPGFPKADSTLRLLKAAEASGVDFVELGIPFSDPLADGPVIQNAAQVALANGITPHLILGLVKELRKTSALPVILMGYVNSFINGIGANFPSLIAEAGVDGVLMPDLSLEESAEIKEKVERAGLTFVSLMAPTSSDERIAEIDASSTDFSYCVSVTGVTGARKNLVSGEVADFLRRVKKIASKPFVVGFGISTPETAKEVARFSNGVVVGSALLQAISNAPEPERAAGEFLGGLRTALGK